MSTREMLEGKTKTELEALAKRFNIPRYKGKTKLSKDELITGIVNGVDNDIIIGHFTDAPISDVITENDFIVETQEAVADVPKENIPIAVPVENVIPEQNNNVEIKFIDRTKYIEEAEPGTLMAFVDNKGKPRTAALVNRSSKRRVVKLVTEFNWEFVVPYENVLWVRNGERWPKVILNILKGGRKNVETANNK